MRLQEPTFCPTIVELVDIPGGEGGEGERGEGEGGGGRGGEGEGGGGEGGGGEGGGGEGGGGGERDIIALLLNN